MDIYSGILAIKGNEIESVEVIWMNLELSYRVKELRRRKTNILMHIYGIWKNGTGEPIYRAAIDRQK